MAVARRKKKLALNRGKAVESYIWCSMIPTVETKKSTNRGNVHFKGRKGWCLRLNRGHKRMYMFFWFNYKVQVLIHFFSGFTYNQFLVNKNNFLDSLQYASKPYFFRCFFFHTMYFAIYGAHFSILYSKITIL